MIPEEGGCSPFPCQSFEEVKNLNCKNKCTNIIRQGGVSSFSLLVVDEGDCYLCETVA